MQRFFLLQQLIENAIREQKPFVAFREPGSDVPEFWQCQTEVLDEDTLLCLESDERPAFLLSPFSGKGGYLFFMERKIEGNMQLFPEACAGKSDEVSEPSIFDLYEEHEADRAAYEASFGCCSSLINEGIVEKIVLSRKRVFPIPLEKVAWADTLFQAMTRYPNAFCYMAYAPEINLWLGASPELLLRKSGSRVESVALAGTMPACNALSQWSDKNQREHEVVVRHIREVFEANAKDVREVGPVSVRTGALLHLSTSFKGILDLQSSLPKFLSELHPTPAISGMPCKRSAELLACCEAYERSFYSGIVGVCCGNSADLFVNLRSLNQEAESLALFAGGGLVSGSSSADEWQETSLKMHAIGDCVVLK